ncbi:MAG: MFS transporter [Betaproteobacteria bacterium]|nr:MFS transporter [Betaproteobacteria bacterium]
MSAERKRWWALYVLCAGELMIVLDTTVVNVALPSIRMDLGFTESSLVWVVNAYMVFYGGFLLLGGRLGDLFGHRKLFLAGIALFTAASVVCGLSGTQWLLVTARAAQGLGGAVVSAIALSLIMDLFTDAGDRARAMGVYGFVCAAGGSIGVLAGGLLTSALNWHWVFLVNLPIGIAIWFLCRALIAPDERRSPGTIDLAGAGTITAGLMLAIYAIVNGNAAGWRSVQTLGLLACSLAFFAAFFMVESRVRAPLMPLRLLARRNLCVAGIIGALWCAAMFAWFFLSALDMQLVLGYDALKIGLAFLPSNVIMAAFSLGLSAKIVLRFGVRAPIFAGLVLAAAGLAVFALAPVQASLAWHILPAMTLLGIGCGMALNPVLLVAMSDAAPDESGLASGVANTAFMMGGALGLAVLASLAEARTAGLLERGTMNEAALAAGYQAAFAVAAGFALVAALAAALVRGGSPESKSTETERRPAWATPSSTGK